MRKIILNLAVSLDGFIEGPNGEFDWCFTDQDYGVAEFLESIDAVFYGRKSYELMLKIAPASFSDKTRYVFSRSLDAICPGYVLIKDQMEEAVKSIKSRPGGRNIWLIGGAEILQSMLKTGAVDELLLSVHPVLLGAGKPLFYGLQSRIPLLLLGSKTFPSGLVQLHYKYTPEG